MSKHVTLRTRPDAALKWHVPLHSLATCTSASGAHPATTATAAAAAGALSAHGTCAPKVRHSGLRQHRVARVHGTERGLHLPKRPTSVAATPAAITAVAAP